MIGEAANADAAEPRPMLTAEDQAFVEDQVLAKDWKRCWFMQLADVRLFEAAGNYPQLYSEGEGRL